ncbi:hypothetical protein GCM10023169_33530 [Georgenia halophila]|uniref:PQQ-binding-like beta-propeller repeat protein n=1 Tax=Georgenia halophila TaxID=620889 RepID=A0ABP8LJJ2_9MICO
MSDEGWVGAEPAGRGEKARVGVAVVAVLLVVALVAAAIWARQHFDDDPVWATDVDGVLGVVDSDEERILLQTETGYTVLSRSDGRPVAAHDVSGINDQALQTHGSSALAFVDGGVLVSGSFSAGYSMTGVLGLDGGWRWRHELDRGRKVVGLDPGGGIVVVFEWRTGTLVGLDSRTGEEAWSRSAAQVRRPGHLMADSMVAEVRVLADELFDSDVRTLVSTADGSVVATVETGPGGGVVVGREAVVTETAECNLRVLRGREQTRVDWGDIDQPQNCQVVSAAGGYAYVAADLPKTSSISESPYAGARVIALDLRSGAAQELPVSAPDTLSVGAYFPLDQGHRWFVTGTQDGLVVHDAATGDRVWEHTWTATPSSTTLRGVLAVGADGIVTEDSPDRWQRWAGGADLAAVTLWQPDGTRASTLYPEFGVVPTDAYLLDGPEAVVALGDGTVALLR